MSSSSTTAAADTVGSAAPVGSSSTMADVSPEHLKRRIEHAVQVVEALASSSFAAVPAGILAQVDAQAAPSPTSHDAVNGDALRTASSVSCLAQLSASARQAGFLEQAKHVKRLLEAYEAGCQAHASADSASAASPLSVALNQQLLNAQCEQKAQLDVDASVRSQAGNTTASSPSSSAASAVAQLRPLTAMGDQFAALRRSSRLLSATRRATAAEGAQSTPRALTFITPDVLSAMNGVPADSATAQSASTPSSDVDACAKRLEALIARATDACHALAQSDSVGGSSSSFSPSRALSLATSPLVCDLARLLSPYLRLVQEVLDRPSLASVTEDDRETLRRVSFDVLERQVEQEQAVIDGDMKRSEDVYLAQVQLLEGMESVFGELETALDRYQRHWVAQPRETLQAIEREWMEKLEPMVSTAREREQVLKGDLATLQRYVAEVRRAREAHKLNVAQYRAEWSKLYQRNVNEQLAAFEAMRELERRMKQLGEEQAFLVRDRLDAIDVEHTRRADAMVFERYAETRQSALRDALADHEQLRRGLDDFWSGAQDSAESLRAYLRDDVDACVSASMVNLQVARLSQFRQLYLTLGDLQFKKARHAEEVHKKVEFYTLQQEVAMDTFNPKAKSYSHARQQWESVYAEVESQLNALENEAQKTLTAFAPTERFLIEAGVSFRSPADELAERNAVRQQKLIEYRRLMDTAAAGVEPQASAHGSAADDTVPTVPLPLTDRADSRNGLSAAVASRQGGDAAEGMNDVLDRELRTIHTHQPRMSRDSLRSE